MRNMSMIYRILSFLKISGNMVDTFAVYSVKWDYVVIALYAEKAGMKNMEKAAFIKLPEEKRKKIVDKAKDIYIEYDYESITIRFLTEKLGMNMTTFYRYFEEKDDLLVYAYRDLEMRTQYEDYSIIYRFINEYSDERDNAFFKACRNIHNREARNKLLKVEQEMLYPIIRQKLKKEKYNGRLLEEVDEDLIAYLYSSVAFNLYDYFDQFHITDIELQNQMKDYVFFSFFSHGICKPLKTE